jgi:hypothetical protein
MKPKKKNKIFISTLRPISVNLFCKNFGTKSKEVKTRCNLAEPSKEGYGSIRAVLPTMKTSYD